VSEDDADRGGDIQDGEEDAGEQHDSLPGKFEGPDGSLGTTACVKLSYKRAGMLQSIWRRTRPQRIDLCTSHRRSPTSIRVGHPSHMTKPPPCVRFRGLLVSRHTARPHCHGSGELHGCHSRFGVSRGFHGFGML
jgi:hypothetical protein